MQQLNLWLFTLLLLAVIQTLHVTFGDLFDAGEIFYNYGPNRYLGESRTIIRHVPINNYSNQFTKKWSSRQKSENDGIL